MFSTHHSYRERASEYLPPRRKTNPSVALALTVRKDGVSISRSSHSTTRRFAKAQAAEYDTIADVLDSHCRFGGLMSQESFVSKQQKALGPPWPFVLKDQCFSSKSPGNQIFRVFQISVIHCFAQHHHLPLTQSPLHDLISTVLPLQSPLYDLIGTVLPDLL